MKASDLDALEKRLRGAADDFADHATPIEGDGPTATLLREVADMIAELKEARRLMKPFAVYYEINDLDERAADDAIEVPVGDLRLVRAFLSRNGKGEGQ